MELPAALQFGEEELADALQQRWQLNVHGGIDEERQDAVLQPFTFLFHDMDDMLRFMEEIMDARGYKANCRLIS